MRFVKLSGTRRRQKGSSLVEFALAAPMFGMLLIGASDFARVFYAGVGISSIATTGAAWTASSATQSALAGSTGNTATDSTNAALIKSAAIVETSTLDGTNTTANTPSLTVTASRTCLCTGSNVSDCSGSAGACADASPRIIAVSVTASMNYVPLIAYPGLPATIPISYTSVMRAQ